MSSRDRRVKPAAPPERLVSVPFVLRVTPTLADRMRSSARSKGFRTVQEWLRSVAIAAIG